MQSIRKLCFGLLATLTAVCPAGALEKQSASVYHARRVALAGKLHGGVAVLFAGEESVVDYMPYRQDSDFYYLTGWSEPGAALLLVAEPESAPLPAETNVYTPRKYTEILFLPTRNLRQEKYTGVKLDAASVIQILENSGKNRRKPRWTRYSAWTSMPSSRTAAINLGPEMGSS